MNAQPAKAEGSEEACGRALLFLLGQQRARHFVHPSAHLCPRCLSTSFPTSHMPAPAVPDHCPPCGGHRTMDRRTRWGTNAFGLCFHSATLRVSKHPDARSGPAGDPERRGRGESSPGAKHSPVSMGPGLGRDAEVPIPGAGGAELPRSPRARPSSRRHRQTFPPCCRPCLPAIRPGRCGGGAPAARARLPAGEAAHGGAAAAGTGAGAAGRAGAHAGPSRGRAGRKRRRRWGRGSARRRHRGRTDGRTRGRAEGRRPRCPTGASPEPGGDPRPPSRPIPSPEKPPRSARPEAMPRGKGRPAPSPSREENQD